MTSDNGMIVIDLAGVGVVPILSEEKSSSIHYNITVLRNVMKPICAVNYDSIILVLQAVGMFVS